MSSKQEQPNPELEVVCEQLEIFDVFNLYGEALDQRQWSLLDDVFTVDASATWFRRHERHGRGNIVAFTRKLLENVASSHHLFGNYSAIVCGSGAEGTVRMRAHYRGHGLDDLFLDGIGSLVGELVLTLDGWRFYRLDHELDVIAGTRELFPSERELEAAASTSRRA